MQLQLSKKLLQQKTEDFVYNNNCTLIKKNKEKYLRKKIKIVKIAKHVFNNTNLGNCTRYVYQS